MHRYSLYELAGYGCENLEPFTLVFFPCTRSDITIDLINGDVKEVVSMKEEESVKVFLTRNYLWMASASEEEGPLVKVVDLEWV
mmetsp:Transcript_1033/g.914  ORF Transcript_1033/g.914 Transcript_1033/m.914 type:complete len:84 (-) Transcript_1033:121-372(-)